MFKTYSFNDVSMSLYHPSLPAYSAIGEGIGEFTVSYANDRTAHEVSSDGYVMVSKIKTANGTISINVLQTSGMNEFLVKWAKYIEQAPSSEYASMTITVSSNAMGENIVCSGVAPQKPGDKPFSAQGQYITWSLMAANISY